ncbi:MAG: hypothetical protein ACE5LV_01455 [Candidatus Aminicenantales bacterium]
MQAIYAFGLLLFLAFLGARFITRKDILSPFHYVVFSGLVYIFLGLSLGRKGLNILSPEVVAGLSPLISLGLGWVGFLFGFQLERRYLRRFPRKYIGFSFLQFLAVFLLGAGIMSLALARSFPSEEPYLLYGMAGALGLLLTLNAPTLLNMAAPVSPQRGDYLYLARFLVSVSGFWGITGLALVSSYWHFPFAESRVLLEGTGFLFGATAFSAGLGVLFHSLTKKRVSEEHLLVFLLGMVFFVSGVAVYFNLPPLYASMVMGLTYSNLSRRQEKLYPLLLSTEKPLYIILVVMIGALWDVHLDVWIVSLACLFILVRILGFVLPSRAIGAVLQFPLRLPGRFGLGFLSAGGIGVAFAVSIKLLYEHPLADVFLSIALIGIILGELIAPSGVKASVFRLDQEGKA